MKQYIWKNLDELFQQLNAECNYLILRNYELISEGKLLSGKHPDIDLLCDNPKKLKNCIKPVLNPKKLHHKSHYWVRIEEQLIEIGIRSVKDGYYDPQWAQNMLDTKILHPKGFFTMNTGNYFYSLIYHAVYQKKSFSDDYLARLQYMARQLKAASPHAETEEFYTTLLNQFMEKEGYFITCPKDFTIPMQFAKIPSAMLRGRRAWKCRKLLHLPERTARFIIRRLQKL